MDQHETPPREPGQSEAAPVAKVGRLKPRTLVTAALLLFVVVSVAFLLVKEAGGSRPQNAPGPDAAVAGTVPGPARGTVAVPVGTVEAPTIVVYYFHSTARCVTCRTIEAYTAEAIQTGFPEALKAGRLQWRVVNVDEPGNEHFIQDFQLTTSSVVVAWLAPGQRPDGKNLARVWELVRGDKGEFLKYVQDGTKGYLEAAGK